MAEPIIEFQGRVTGVERELIPKIHLCRIESNDGKTVVEMDMHEDIIVYRPGETVRFGVYRGLPDYREGEDFVGRATVASIRRENGTTRVLLSIGGLLVIITTQDEAVDLKPTEKVYVLISRM